MLYVWGSNIQSICFCMVSVYMYSPIELQLESKVKDILLNKINLFLVQVEAEWKQEIMKVLLFSILIHIRQLRDDDDGQSKKSKHQFFLERIHLILR